MGNKKQLEAPTLSSKNCQFPSVIPDKSAKTKVLYCIFDVHVILENHEEKKVEYLWIGKWHYFTRIYAWIFSNLVNFLTP